MEVEALTPVEEEPQDVGPPFGGEFDPVPVTGILALPAFHAAPEDVSSHAPGYYEDIDDDASYDSDSESDVGNDALVVPSRSMTTFLGRTARFASYQGTAAFMRISTTAALTPGAAGGSADGVISVHYRYNRFYSGPRGVEAPPYRRDTHHVRFLVPRAAVAADPSGALLLAGAWLAADADADANVYPRHARARLQALWSALLAAAPVRLPAAARRLVVTVDVGALVRGEDRRTPELVECMRPAIAAQAREVDASPPILGREQHLPAPVVVPSPGVVTRAAAKRRRVEGGVAAAAAAGEDGDEVCSICCEVMMLEQAGGLAAWPRCSHVFHGRCLEQLLATVRHRCPLCRSTLSVGEVFRYD